MYYISSKYKGKFGVTNTEDGVERVYTIGEILLLPDEINIHGVSDYGIEVYNPCKEISDVDSIVHCDAFHFDVYDNKITLEEYKGTDRSVFIPDFVTELDYMCFADQYSLERVVIPDSVTLIENNCFEGCINLTEVSIPNSVTKIGSESFYDCQKLEHVYIPDSVLLLDDYCFENCKNLKEVSLPAEIVLGEGVFPDQTRIINRIS